jgi:3-methyladenine DNA glycosylase AlkD
MPRKPKRTKADVVPLQDQLDSVLTWLERRGKKSVRDGLARYGIPADAAFGVTVAALRVLARKLGRNHELAVALWDTGRLEARLLAPFLGDPDRVTPALMDRWCRTFDNWAVCDAACFHLFDRTPHAFRKVALWAGRRDEFAKRAAFALLASIALHDKAAADDAFARCLPVVERAAADGRNFVKKGVSWALRGIGRRNPTLHAAAIEVAERLAASTDAACRWVGKDALRELTGPVVMRRLAKQRRA